LTTLRVSVGLDQIKKKAANAATAAEDVPTPNSSSLEDFSKGNMEFNIETHEYRNFLCLI
jgi:hypothetical protein